MEGVSTLTFPGQFRSLYHHFSVTIDHWKLQKHGITLMLKLSDTRAPFVKTHSYVCRRLLRITWRWHRSSTSSTVRWAAPSRWDCGIVRLWRGEIVRLLRKKFLNWWNSHMPPNSQQRGYDATGQFSLFIDKFCQVENFFYLMTSNVCFLYLLCIYND